MSILIQIGKLSLKFLYSFLNQRKNSANAWTKLKIKRIDFKKMKEILQADLNFEEIYSDKQTSIFFMHHRSILTDTLCVCENRKDEMHLTVISK